MCWHEMVQIINALSLLFFHEIVQATHLSRSSAELYFIFCQWYKKAYFNFFLEGSRAMKAYWLKWKSQSASILHPNPSNKIVQNCPRRPKLEDMGSYNTHFLFSKLIMRKKNYGFIYDVSLVKFIKFCNFAKHWRLIRLWKLDISKLIIRARLNTMAYYRPKKKEYYGLLCVAYHVL